MRPLAPDFKTYIFGIVLQFPTDWLKQNFWVFFYWLGLQDPCEQRSCEIALKTPRGINIIDLLPKSQIYTESLVLFLSRFLYLVMSTILPCYPNSFSPWSRSVGKRENPHQRKALICLEVKYSHFLAVQDSSITDIVGPLVGLSVGAN